MEQANKSLQLFLTNIGSRERNVCMMMTILIVN
jgi:hypothetical protein